MSRGFSSLGASSSDLITTRLTAIPTQHSIAIWAYAAGTGGGNFGKAIISSQTTGPFLGSSDAGTTWQVGATYSGGSGSWNFTAKPLNEWHHVAYTLDGSTASNNPVGYMDGTSVAVTGAGSSGTPSFGNALYIGNRSDLARVWDGMIAHFCMWGAVLTAAEIRELANGANPMTVRPEAIVSYIPLDGCNSPEPDLIRGNTSAVSGTRRGTSEAPALPFTAIQRRYSFLNTLTSAPATASAVFRRTLSGQGTRVGARQSHGWQ